MNPNGLSKAQIAGVVAGNWLEFYDFLTYAFFSAQIGRALFPVAGGHSLLLSLATFGVGFVTRPLGGLVIGRIADRQGRRPAMLLTFLCMGVSLVGLALTPGFAAIGWAAPVLAVVFRMAQGFALGGEVGPNTAFLLEAAPAGRRGLYVSCQYASQHLATLTCGLVGFGLASALSPAQLDGWGWRVAFLLGAVIVPFGLVMRRSLPETLVVGAAEAGGAGRGFWLVAAGGLLMLAAGTISNYTLNYLTTYAQTTLGMHVGTAFGATIVIGAVGMPADLLVGWLVDRYGAKRVLVGPWVLLTVLIVPGFFVIAALRSGVALLGVTGVLAALLGGSTVPALVLFTIALPAGRRAGAVGIVYAVSIAVFGGSAQVVEQGLIDWSGNAVAPGWYMMAGLVVGFAGVFLVREGGADSRGRARVAGLAGGDCR